MAEMITLLPLQKMERILRIVLGSGNLLPNTRLLLIA